MVELVRPRAMEPPAGAPAAAAPMAEAPAPDTSPPPAPLPKPVAAAKPTPVAVKRISPKKKPTPSTAPPSPSPERTPQPQQTAAPQEPSGAGGGVGKTAGPSHMVGGMGVYDAAVVDIPPRIIARELPQYPPGARRLHLEGTVLVSMIIDSQGNPTHCAVRKAEPKGVFEESALAAASGYRFVPGKVAGQNVATLVLVPFHFKMTN
ncbi:TonB family protein [Solidesulfovibrio sp.]|uniref:energy transducer TonB n=1 Tax=Solidesulfovibrio sp. TaxID=2910990 RepID=UPI002B1F655B|nr:TonB family protein [Solidesulfovibrio sp.]MEA5088296.1 TonB family protein [Solidesulfovibrio sp.]